MLDMLTLIFHLLLGGAVGFIICLVIFGGTSMIRKMFRKEKI